MKAKGYFDQSGISCFADDTGLEIEALNGMPGVYSSSFGGIEGDSTKNIHKVLMLLANEVNRNARFRTVICLYDGNNSSYFEGILEGQIAFEPKGTNGFGYDPIFYPKGSSITLAQMTTDEKNLISHRRRAFYKLMNYLNL